MTQSPNQTDPSLAVVSYAQAPGPGGPEAQISAALARRLATQWRGPLAFYSGGRPPADAQGLALAALRDDLESWSAASDPGPSTTTRALQRLTLSSQARRRSVGRLVSRLLYERSGYSIKYHAFERGAAHLLRQQLRRDPDTVVWSRVLPVVSMTTAHRALSKLAGPGRHRWIVNFNDPCPPHIYRGLYPLDERTEAKLARTVQRVLPRIDAATFPSRRLHELHVAALPALTEIPARIIPHVQDDLPFVPSHISRDPGAPLLAFAGTLRHDHLGHAFAEALRRLARRQPEAALRFRFLLTSPSRALEQLAREAPFAIEIHDASRDPGSIDVDLAKADALICFETEIDRPLLLTKIAGYLRFGAPILGLCAPGGTTDELLSRSSLHQSVPFDDPDAIAEVLTKVQARDRSQTKTDPVAQRFDSATVADQLRALLDDLASRRRGLQGPEWP